MTVLFANNANTTIAANINSGVTSVTLATGTGALFPNPTGGDYFLMTFKPAAPSALNEIVKVTARAGDVCTIVRGQEGTAAAAWSAGDIAAGLITAGALAAMLQQTNARTRLAAATPFYIRTDGSDSNTGLVNNAGGAWLTLQHAINVLQSTYDINVQAVTINLGAGTFAGANLLNLVGVGTSVVINGAGATTIFSSALNGSGFGANYLLQNMKFVCAADNAVTSGTGASISIGASVEFGACLLAHVYAPGGIINVNTSYTISGGSSAHYQANNKGLIVVSGGITVTLSGTPNFSSAFSSIDANSFLNMSGNGGFAVFSGGATGQRFFVDNLSLISTGGSGVNYYPGNSAGVNNGHGAIYN